MDHETDKTFSYAINDKDENQRIDIFLATRAEDLTRTRIQNLIKEGFVKVNDHPSKPNYRLKRGDRVDITIPPAIPIQVEPEPVDFTVVHEDKALIVVNKPPGLVSHPAPGHHKGTLVHGLLHHCRDLSGIGGVLRPGIVHRLDKDTSGLMVVAKSDRVHAFLSRQFKSGTVIKRYVALMHGIIPGSKGEIDLPIARHPKRRKEMAVLPSRGKRSLTLWRKKEKIGHLFSVITVTPKTGRTHQIRVHFSHLGYPIVGDPVYGHKKGWWKRHFPSEYHIAAQIKRQMLHAETLGFVHPDSEEYVQYNAPIPQDMTGLISSLRSLFALR